MIQFTKGQPPVGTKRILAKIGWGGDPYFDVLYWHEFSDLRHPQGWHDHHGEDVPVSTIVEYAEF